MPTKHRGRNSARSTAHRMGAHTLRSTTAIATSIPPRRAESTLLLKVAPALHGDLGAIELAVLVVAALVGACDGAGGLPRVTPAEIVKVPEGVGGEDEVPDWEGEEVDEHPEDVDEAVRGDDDEDTGETKDEDEEDQGDGWGGSVGEGRLETESD